MALIEMIGVTKTFEMGKETIFALDQISLSIEQGEFIAITGPSGCGKSTLMNILGLLDKPTAGSYSLDKKPTDTLTDDERAMLRNNKIGFVFQTFNLLPRATALRNVEMPIVYAAAYDRSMTRDKRSKMSREALEKVSLFDRMDHKPNELSGGQRQRVAIARALVNQPKILLADEPTGNLDSKSGKEILALFEDLNRSGVTVILVTHDPTIATRAHRVISMLDGRILEDHVRGTHVV
jgi:putative ABC transport system ATP-binding protein